MAKNDFRMTSIFKIIICMKNVEFCRKTSKFLPKRCMLNFKRVSKIPENFSLVTLVTNYYKLSLLPLVVRP